MLCITRSPAARARLMVERLTPYMSAASRWVYARRSGTGWRVIPRHATRVRAPHRPTAIRGVAVLGCEGTHGSEAAWAHSRGSMYLMGASLQRVRRTAAIVHRHSPAAPSLLQVRRRGSSPFLPQPHQPAPGDSGPAAFFPFAARPIRIR